MNWLGLDLRAFAAAIVGCVLGFFTYGYLMHALGMESPWVIGLMVGGATALGSSSRSKMRGLVVGTLALWTAASAQALNAAQTPAHGIVDGLVGFHATLDLVRLAQLTIGTLLAIGLGALSLGGHRDGSGPSRQAEPR